MAAPAGERRTAGSLLARLGNLHRNRLQQASLPLAQRLALVEGFADGWSRRRAVQALLSVPAPPGVDDALALLRTLAAQRDRNWCLSLLLTRGGLGEDEIEQLLDVVDAPAARLRLTRRLRRIP